MHRERAGRDARITSTLVHQVPVSIGSSDGEAITIDGGSAVIRRLPSEVDGLAFLNIAAEQWWSRLFWKLDRKNGF